MPEGKQDADIASYCLWIDCHETGVQETHVVMEWCEGGSLDSAVEQGQFHLPSVHGWGQQADALKICATLLDIVSGMAYLHQLHILHRDLKLKNVLLKISQVIFAVKYSKCH